MFSFFQPPVCREKFCNKNADILWRPSPEIASYIAEITLLLLFCIWQNKKREDTEKSKKNSQLFDESREKVVEKGAHWQGAEE